MVTDKSMRIKGVDEIKEVDIGSYEVSILKASHVDNLNEWLEKNDFIKIPPLVVRLSTTILNMNGPLQWQSSKEKKESL